MLVKAKTLIPKTAKKLNLPEEVVSDIIDFYYSQLRKEVELLRVSRIRIPAIGVLYFSRGKLEESIDTLTHLTKGKEPDDFKQLRIYNSRLELIKAQQNLLELIYKENKEYDERKKNMGRKT